MTTSTPPPAKGRSTQQVRVPRELYERLWYLRKPGESIADALRRLLSHDDAKHTDDLSDV